jgi:hypothetical protein
MTEQHLPSYQRDFNSEVEQFRDIAARFKRSARHCLKSKVQRFRDIVERLEDSTKERVRLYSIRRWRTARIERFTKIQRDKREWINFAEIAEYCSEESGVVPNEVARETAYEKLLADLLDLYFEENGVSQIMYLHPYTSKTRMTREWMGRLVAFKDADRATIISQYLAHCWMRRALSERWFAKHRMEPRPPRFEPKRQTPSATTQPSSPPRFQALQESRAGISPEAEGRAPEIPIPAPMVAPQPVVKIVDQPEVPSGIEPTEVRVPTPQDGDEPRSLVQDSPLPSDECSDLNTQRNKGGRPPAVDWEALKDALAEEIKSSGFPDRKSPPGWRSTKDVADWVEEKLGKEAEHVARRTIEDNVRKMINELRASMAKMVSR